MVDAPITATVASFAAGSATRSSRYRWVVVTVLLLAVTTAFFDRINVAVLFTNADFKQAMGIGNNPAMLGLLMTGFVLAYGASAIILSGSSDLFGPRRTLSLISMVLAVAMGLMGGAASFAAMLAGRIVLGVAEGPQFGVANLAVKRWFPPGDRSLGTALWTIGSPLGSMIGFPLIIFLVAQYGWRASFYLLAGINAVIVLPAVWLLLRDRPAAPLVAASDAVPFAAAIRLFIADPKFWLLAIYDCGAMVYLWGFNSWLPAYLQQARHFDVLHSSLFSSFPFLVMIGGQIFGAWLGDRTGRKSAICLVGLLLAGLCVLAATSVTDATEAALFLAASAGCWGATVPTLFALGTVIIPGKVTAMGFGVYAGLANLVGAAAPWLMGWLIGASGDFTAGLSVIVVSCVVLSLAMLPLLRRY